VTEKQEKMIMIAVNLNVDVSHMVESLAMNIKYIRINIGK